MTQAQDTALPLGANLGPYRIEAALGVTETGALYRAAAPDGSPRLLKLVHSELCALPGLCAALAQQALFLAELVHPGIAQVEQLETGDEYAYLALEWLPDATLRDLLRRRGSLADDLPLALDLAAQIAAALAFAHGQGFVHGSLSPEDLLLARRDDGGYRLKVSDFGLAWLLIDYDLPPAPWADSLIYAFAPERCRGLEADGRADQYALGAILYELLTACVPFAARNLDDAVAGHVYGEPLPPRLLNPAIPPALEQLILRCLAKERAERYADTATLAAELAALSASYPLTTAYVPPAEDAAAGLALASPPPDEVPLAPEPHAAQAATALILPLAAATLSGLVAVPDPPQAAAPPAPVEPAPRAQQAAEADFSALEEDLLAPLIIPTPSAAQALSAAQAQAANAAQTEGPSVTQAEVASAAQAEGPSAASAEELSLAQAEVASAAQAEAASAAQIEGPSAAQAEAASSAPILAPLNPSSAAAPIWPGAEAASAAQAEGPSAAQAEAASSAPILAPLNPSSAAAPIWPGAEAPNATQAGAASVAQAEEPNAAQTEGLSASSAEGLSAPILAPLNPSSAAAPSWPETEAASASSAEAASALQAEGMSAAQTEGLSASSAEGLSAPILAPLNPSSAAAPIWPGAEAPNATQAGAASAAQAEEPNAAQTEGLSASSAEGLSAPILAPLNPSSAAAPSWPETEAASASSAEGMSAAQTEGLSASSAEGPSAPILAPLNPSSAAAPSWPGAETPSALQAEGPSAAQAEALNAAQAEAAPLSPLEAASFSPLITAAASAPMGLPPEPPQAPQGEQVIFAAIPRSWAPQIYAAPPKPAPQPAPAEPAPEPAPASAPEPMAPEPEPDSAPEPVLPAPELGLAALLKTPARQFEPPDLIGQLLAGYHIESFLGPTETGPVYQVRRPEATGPRAMKVLSAHLTQDNELRRHFHERSASLQTLAHPHLVKIEAIGEAGGLCYVVMEWLPDGSLRNLMQRRGSAAWSLPLALDLSRQAAEALAFIHREGLTHGSIKPNNLLLSRREDGQPGYTLKLTDVGLGALLIEREHALEDIWSDALIYAMPPERCQGLAVNGRSDQYALGVILYELATGSVPFEARTLDDAIFRHVYTVPVPPRTIVPALPEALEAIILRCLAKAPAERFSDATALADALGDLLRSPAMAPRALAGLRSPSSLGAVRTGGPLQPRIQALDQYGHVLSTRDLTGDGLRIGRDQSNAIVLDDPEVEPQQLDLDWDGSAIIVTSLAQQALTMVGDTPLRPRESRVWAWEEPIRLSRFYLRAEAVPQLSDAAPPPPPRADAFAPPPPRADVFAAPVRTSVPPPGIAPPGGTAPIVITLPSYEGRSSATGANPTIPLNALPAPAAAPARPAPSDPSGANEQLTDRIGISLEQDSLTLTPGRAATLRMTLLNLGNIVDHFSVSVEGVPANWISGQAPQVQLNPGVQEDLTLNVLVPQVPESLAQEYPVTIRARSRENPRESNTALALWTVLPFASSSFDLRPRRRRKLLGGAYQLSLRNQGNAPATYLLNASDEEEVLSYQFSEDRLTVAPGAAKRADLQVRPNQWRWFGAPIQHRFNVQARPQHLGEVHTGGAQFTQLVFFPRWLLFLLLLLLLLSLLGAWLWYRPRIIEFGTVPQVPVAGNAFAVRWAVTNGPTVELLVNQTIVPIVAGSSSHILDQGFSEPPDLRLVARNEVLGRANRELSVSLVEPTRTPTRTPTPEPTFTLEPTVPPPTRAPLPPTVPPPTRTPTITPTPTSQALCVVGSLLRITGQGPPSVAVLLFFDDRPVGGGVTDAAGRFSIDLGRVRERPGLYEVSVRVRDSGEQLRILECIVPSPTPRATLPSLFTPTVPPSSP